MNSPRNHPDSKVLVDRRDVLKALSAGGVLLGLGKNERALGTEQKVKAISHETMENLVASHIRWPRTEQVLQSGDDCVDPRKMQGQEDATGIAGVPGGGAGLAAAGLQTAQELTREKVTPGHTNVLIAQYPGAFSFHTDLRGVHAIIDAMQDDSILKKFAPTAEAALHLIKHGTTDSKAEIRLRAIMEEKDKQGCSHVKHLLTDPAAYNADPAIMTKILDTTIRRLHTGSSDHMDILKGDHQEGAVLEVDVLGGIQNAQDQIPTFDRVDGPQFFVLTPALAEFRFKQMYPILKRLFPSLKEDDFLEESNKLFGHQTLQTGQRLAGKKNHYILRADRTKQNEPQKLEDAPPLSKL